MRRPHISSQRLVLSLLAILGLLVLGAGGGQAADPFVAGGRSTRPVPAAADQLDHAGAEGRALAVALGVPAVSQKAVRLDDQFEHRTYDEVTSYDAAGRQVGIARFDLDGSVAMAVSLGWHPSGGRPIDSAAATDRAAGFARAAGVAVLGKPSIRASAGAGGWSIDWPRVVGGVPVRGDGVRILLFPDGAFHGLTQSRRPLAAVPARSLTAAAARAAAGVAIGQRFGPLADDLRTTAVEQAWLAGNDQFGPSRLDAPSETVRLAWIIRLDSRGQLAERIRSVEIWIDATDGGVLGGDTVE